MTGKRIPAEVRQHVDQIVKEFNQTVLKNPNYYYVTRYRGNYLYLNRFDYGHVGPICRLTYTGSMDAWEFAIYKYSDERYDPDEEKSSCSITNSMSLLRDMPTVGP